MKTLSKMFGRNRMGASLDSISIEYNYLMAVFCSHPGAVCLYGRAMSNFFPNLVDFKTNRLLYQNWVQFSAKKLPDILNAGPIVFKRMIDSLQSQEATSALNLYRTQFAGSFDFVSFDSENNLAKLADFLTSEGVLLRPDSDAQNYRVVSPMTDTLIRKFVIPTKFPGSPPSIPPKTEDGHLIVLDVLTEAIRHFDMDHMRNARLNSFKSSKVMVGGGRGMLVPRESVYETELMRILSNWLPPQLKYAVSCQWHLRTDEKEDRYCDVVIWKPQFPTILLELLATCEERDIRSHMDKILGYKSLLCADVAWVIHFTCEDEYTQNATWQSDEELKAGINVAHVVHDLEFTDIRIAARWTDAGIVHDKRDVIIMLKPSMTVSFDYNADTCPIGMVLAST
jgi:hypothetical protein